jgi:hypothetical protein
VSIAAHKFRLLIKYQHHMKFSLTTLRTIILVCLLAVLSYCGFSQTQPIPFTLSSGTFHFTSWDSLSSAGTYPANMIFQFVPSNHIAPFYDDSASDYSCPYNLAKRPRLNGYMEKGISFLTTSNSQYNDCSSGAADKRFVGAALLSLNAGGRTNIRVQWTSETLIPGDGNGTPANPRIWNLRLQYRVGTSGNFTDVPGPVQFVAGAATGDATILGPTALPADCNNKPIVQLRWIYFESSAGNAGTRPRLRLDDISVQSDPTVGIDEYNASKLEIYPNPTRDEFYILCTSVFDGKIRIMDNIGKVVKEMPYRTGDNGYECAGLPAGIYFVQLFDNATKVCNISKLVIRK